MSVTAQQLQTWIGAEVLDRSAEKLGKLEDVYFSGDEPLAVTIRSGLAGRKHHAATLRGATVSRDHLHVAITATELVGTSSDGLGAAGWTELAAQDDRLRDIAPDAVESWKAREARLEELAKADAAAAKLDVEAHHRAEDEDAAAVRASEAEHEAQAARQAREDAEARAEQVRTDAGLPH
jgi:hypothetical protein